MNGLATQSPEEGIPGSSRERVSSERGLAMAKDILFEPLQFKNLAVKNRVFRSNLSGRFDNYDGSGNQARINREVKFARGGVGAIISSFVPVQIQGRILPNYATIDRDDGIPFWRELGKRLHKQDKSPYVPLFQRGI